MSGLAAALGFLTRLPLPRSRRHELLDVAAAQAWFPAVGLLIGLVLLGVDRATSRALPPVSVAVLDVVALTICTGALHLDGLADAADGLFGGTDAKSRLAIMHDVHTGTFGVVAVICVLALKFAGIAALPVGVRFEALLLAPCLARLAMLVAVAAFPYARSEGTGASFHAAAWPRAVVAGGATALVAAVVLLGANGVYAVAFAAACGLLVGAVATQLVGGMTGDLYGATLEMSEACALIFLAACAERGWLTAWLLR